MLLAVLKKSTNRGPAIDFKPRGSERGPDLLSIVEGAHDLAASGKSQVVDYLYEEPVAEIFGGLVPRYLEAEVYRILLESAAA